MKLTRLFICILFLLLFFTKCKKEEVNLSQLTSNHNLAFPLVSAEISIEDMLESDTDSVISQQPDSSLYLAYDTDPISFSVDDLAITIPNESFTVSADFQDLPTALPFPADTTIEESQVNSFSFDFNGVTPELRNILLSSGILSISLSNEMNHEISISITIPSLIMVSGEPYSQTLTASANDVANASQGLINSNLDLTKADTLNGYLGYNEIVVDIEFTVLSNGVEDFLSPTEKFDLDFSITNMDFVQIEGDLKNHKFDLEPIELVLNIFENSSSAINFQLTNSEINFDIIGDVGLSAYLGMDTMYYEDLTGQKLGDIKYDSLGPELKKAPFYFPALNSSNNLITLDKENSTIDSLINNTPKKLIAQPFLEINPGESTENNNVIRKVSDDMIINSEILLPLQGYAGGWKIGDTLEFDFKVDSLFTDNTTIDSTEIKFTTTNGWPVELTLSIELFDLDPRTNPNISPITSIANQEIILESGFIEDPISGRVTQPTIKNTVLACDYECVQSLNQTKFLTISAAASTENYTDQQSVKIYKDYELKLVMALLVSGKIF